MIHNQKRGFTIIELIMTLAIFGMVAVGLITFSVYYFRNYSFSFSENQSISNAQNSLTAMIREIREARTGEDGSWPIINAEDNLLEFFSDVTNDGRSDKVKYYLEGNVLKKSIIQPTLFPVTYPVENETIYTLSDNLDPSGNPIFTYYNDNWPQDQFNNPLAVGSRLYNTRYIKVYLKIKTDSDLDTAGFELTSGVSVRSMKDNL